MSPMADALCPSDSCIGSIPVSKHPHSLDSGAPQPPVQLRHPLVQAACSALPLRAAMCTKEVPAVMKGTRYCKL